MNGEYNDFYFLERDNNPTPLQLSEQTGYIKLLKRKLRERNYFKGEIDGRFDDNVRNAIMQLQQDHGLALTGIVDDKVLEVLLDSSHLSISKEEYTSDDVIILEMKLKKVGPSQVEIKKEKPIEKELKPKLTEKKLWEMLIPQEGIEGLYPPLFYGEEIYIVKRGDTLWSIAKRFHTTVDDIMTVNNLHNTLLSIGQQLIIPGEITFESMPIIYTVKPGDNLWSISRRYKTTIDDIMMVNNLTNTLLSIGQQLIIPSVTPQTVVEPQIVSYTVQKGDTLWSLAKRFGITTNEIKRINNLPSDFLSVGQELIIVM